MSPELLEGQIPPAEKNVGDPFAWKGRVFAILGIIAFGLMILFFIRQFSPVQINPKTVLPASIATSPTPLPQTGTFVDNLYGTFLYVSSGSLIEFELPSRLENGVEGQNSTSLPISPDWEKFPPVWSTDGELLFLFKDSKTLTGVNFDTGAYVNTYLLREDRSESLSLLISASPGNEVLSVGSPTDQNKSEQLQFFDISSGAKLGFYDNCAPKGIWVEYRGFVAKCKLGSEYSIVLIQFFPTSSQMVTIAKETPTLHYQLLEPYDESYVFVSRVEQSGARLGKLSFEGKFVPLTAAEQKLIPSIQIAVDPIGELTKRIATETKLPNISQVQVFSDNSWVLFRSNESIYVAPLNLKDKPYELAKGSLVRLRPR